MPDLLWAGEYLNSAHGSSAGAQRLTGYATGNCAHCHEMHASIAGSEPDPLGGPSPYTLFATNFNSGTSLPGSYLVADNFCFYCHSASTSVQPVANKDYSATFGGAATGVQSIMDAFNQPSSAEPNSYHDLAGIHTFAEGKFPWYSADSNPCNACHNPHMARKNYEDFLTPLSSAISKPSDHFNLWGDSEDNTETMATYSRYEAPYSDPISKKREPDGASVSDGVVNTGQGWKTPDYAGFCLDCHQYAVGSLLVINWGSGDKHGVVARDALVGATSDTSLDGRNPYEAVDHSTDNFVLSCLDCHEPHGSPNIMLLRRQVNGESVDVTSLDSMANLCARCHSSNWEYIHHLSEDHPYVKQAGQCNDCHAGDGGFPIFCGKCHFHGSDDSWVPIQKTTPPRKTF